MTTVNIQSMSTQQGNALVQRIVDAAVKMNTELGATYNECEDFINKNLKTLSGAEEFTDADTNLVRMDAYYEYSVGERKARAA